MDIIFLRADELGGEKAFQVLPEIEDSHRRLNQKAARSAFGPNRKNAHSPGVIQYLNELPSDDSQNETNGEPRYI